MAEMCLFPHLAPTTSYRYGCRCIGCKDGMEEAWRRRKKRQRQREQELAEQVIITKNLPGSKSLAHGTGRRYGLGCRCNLCKAWYRRIGRKAKRAK